MTIVGKVQKKIKKYANAMKQKAFIRKHEEEIKNRLSLSYIVPGYEPSAIDTETEKKQIEKKRVGFLLCEETSFNMIYSLYNTFSDDDEFEAIVILQNKGYKNQFRGMAELLREKGLRFAYDFDCTDKNFEILFVTHIHLTPCEDVKKIINNTKHCINIHVGVIKYSEEIISIREFEQYRIETVMIEKKLLSSIDESNYPGIKFYPTGNPKFDYIYDYCEKNEYKLPENFKKIGQGKFRKVFLWTTDHNPGFLKVSPDVSFDLYASFIFEYMRKHQDVAMIFRPYSTYIDENIRNGFWNENDVKLLHEYIDESKNIVWDKEPDYGVSYSIADAIISDVGCGIIGTALPIAKPIGVPLRWDMDCNNLIKLNEKVLEGSYLINSLNEMGEWLDMICREEDPKREIREKTADEYITNYDGKNAERIKELCEEAYS